MTGATQERITLADALDLIREAIAPSLGDLLDGAMDEDKRYRNLRLLPPIYERLAALYDEHAAGNEPVDERLAQATSLVAVLIAAYEGMVSPEWRPDENAMRWAENGAAYVGHVLESIAAGFDLVETFNPEGLAAKAPGRHGDQLAQAEEVEGDGASPMTEVATRNPEDVRLLMRGAVEGVWRALIRIPNVGTEEEARACIAMAQTAVTALGRVLPTAPYDLDVLNTRGLVQAAAVSLAATLEDGSGVGSVADATAKDLWEAARWSVNAAMVGTDGVANSQDLVV